MGFATEEPDESALQKAEADLERYKAVLIERLGKDYRESPLFFEMKRAIAKGRWAWMAIFDLPPLKKTASG